MPDARRAILGAEAVRQGVRPRPRARDAVLEHVLLDRLLVPVRRARRALQGLQAEAVGLLGELLQRHGPIVEEGQLLDAQHIVLLDVEAAEKDWSVPLEAEIAARATKLLECQLARVVLVQRFECGSYVPELLFSPCLEVHQGVVRLGAQLPERDEAAKIGVKRQPRAGNVYVALQVPRCLPKLMPAHAIRVVLIQTDTPRLKHVPVPVQQELLEGVGSCLVWDCGEPLWRLPDIQKGEIIRHQVLSVVPVKHARYRLRLSHEASGLT
mmetsp:Transcript_109979/g.317969  ORF Transcript_109979/g.317969 Transcript_109979/m.317969 type:complete len:268 (+) Transcript_109979:417-1220(+)